MVIVAAGQGTRAGDGEPKQFRPIAGVPMVLRAIRPFASHPAIDDVVVVLPPASAENPPEFLASVAGDRLRLVAGGQCREESVFNGLNALPDTLAVVLIHDAARPFVNRETIDAVLDAAREGHGAVAAVPVTDTLRRAAENGQTETLPRQGLWRAQTPQAFPAVALRDAFTNAVDRLGDFTDDAGVWEAEGHSVVMVEDLATNLKITTPLDFALADALARTEP